MTENKPKSAEILRKEVDTFLAALTPAEAKALRARFGIEAMDPVESKDEAALREIARELSILTKKAKKKSS